MRTIDYYLQKKYGFKPDVDGKGKKQASSIHIDFPESQVKKIADVSSKIKKTVVSKKNSLPVHENEIKPIGIIVEDKYSELKSVVFVCSECGQSILCAKRTGKNSDYVDSHCPICSRKLNINGFLPFSKEPLCGKTKENSPLFNKLVSELVNFEVVKF